MTETQLPTIGYFGEFWLFDGSALYELRQVKEFDIPEDGQRAEVQVTHLKSPGYRHEYVKGFYQDTDFTVTLNSRLLSTTDTVLEAAHLADDVRAFKAVIPENGVPTADRSGTCRCIGYSRGRVTAEGVIEATATFRIVTLAAVVAHV